MNENSSPKPVGTILLIDDDPISRTHVAAVLKEHGLTCISLPSPIGATRTILEQEIKLVLIDVMMPAMRGDQLAKLLRRNKRLGPLGVILISSSSDPEFERLAQEAEADAWVSKADLESELLVQLEQVASTLELTLATD